MSQNVNENVSNSVIEVANRWRLTVIRSKVVMNYSTEWEQNDYVNCESFQRWIFRAREICHRPLTHRPVLLWPFRSTLPPVCCSFNSQNGKWTQFAFHSANKTCGFIGNCHTWAATTLNNNIPYSVNKNKTHDLSSFSAQRLGVSLCLSQLFHSRARLFAWFVIAGKIVTENEIPNGYGWNQNK